MVLDANTTSLLAVVTTSRLIGSDVTTFIHLDLSDFLLTVLSDCAESHYPIRSSFFDKL